MAFPQTTKDLERLAKLCEKHILKQKISLFAKKYGKNFSDFEKDVLSKEDFEKWDDYMEWRAYLKVLKNLTHI